MYLDGELHGEIYFCVKVLSIRQCFIIKNYHNYNPCNQHTKLLQFMNSGSHRLHISFTSVICFAYYTKFRAIYTYGFQLLPSSGCNPFVTSNITSTIHQIPTPPKVNSFPTAVPVCPRQNLSIPRKPNKILQIRVVAKQWPLYL